MESKQENNIAINRYNMKNLLIYSWLENKDGITTLDITFFPSKKIEPLPVVFIFECEGQIEVTLEYDNNLIHWYLPFDENGRTIHSLDNQIQQLNYEVCHGSELTWNSSIQDARIRIDSNQENF